MSATSEAAYEISQHAEPAPPMTVDAWHTMVHDATNAAWKDSGATLGYFLTYRLVDAALRNALPALAPEVKV
jgi:hypothetical protein